MPGGASTLLATRFAAAARLGPDAIADAVERAGAGGVVLDRSLAPALEMALCAELARRGVPVVALEAPGAAARGAELASLDREEAHAALDVALAAVRRAGELGARFVVLALGHVQALDDDWKRARGLFLRDDLYEELIDRWSLAREVAGARPCDVALAALDRLVRAAESAGVELALPNARRFIELPTVRELRRLTSELRGAPLGPMFDVGAAHLGDVMGFCPWSRAQAAFGAARLVYLGDACGAVGALAPGRGELDVPAIARALAPEATVAFSPWPGLTIDETVDACQAVARLR